MFPAVKDVHHRRWEDVGVNTTNILIEGYFKGNSCGFGYRQTGAQDGVGTQFGFVLRTIQV